jgi:hypothetical protein
MGTNIDFDLAYQLNQLRYPELPLSPEANLEVLNRLWMIIESRTRADPDVSHSARLLAMGTARVTQSSVRRQ